MEQLLITLLVKIGVVTSIAGFGVRSETIKRMLLREERTLRQRLTLAVWFAAIFAPGVLIRVLTRSYSALDLALEASFLAGITGGYICGWVAAMMIAIPAMFHGELLTLPFLAAVGLGGGLLRDSPGDKEEIWRFSPFPDVNIYRVFQQGRELRSALFHVFFSLGVVAAEFIRQVLGTEFPGALFSVTRWNETPLLILATYMSTYFCITLPLKVWNNTRNEAKLEEQQRLLMQARLEALASQINPHFLFNTLNSVSSLIRMNPEQARNMVVRLARIMRRRLRNQDHFAPLREELDFVDDYLSIESVRFGDKLRIVKEIDPVTLDMMVPSMLLQPLIENSIKHGISCKVEGGTVTLRTSVAEGRLTVVVEDDGAGIPEDRLAGIFEHGIGVSNVKERLEVLYSQDHRMVIDSREGQGTRIEIELPQSLTRLAAVS